MEQRPFGNSSAYMDCVLRMYTTSSKFIDSTKKKNIRLLSDPTKGKLPDMVTRVGKAHLSYVANLQQHVSTLDAEFDSLMKKLNVFKKSYSSDSTMIKFLGDYKKSPNGTVKHLNDFIDGSKRQNESVITAYSNILKDTNKARQWILSILASEQTSDKVKAKAREASKLMQDLDHLIDEIRTVCQDANFEMVQIKTTVNKFIAPKTTDYA